MTAKKISELIGCTERHARRLKAAGDPRVRALEKPDISDMRRLQDSALTPEQWRAVEVELLSQ
jgi:hypothetical protein